MSRRKAICMPNDPSATNSDLQAAVNQLRDYIDERTQNSEARLRDYIDERTHDAETRLLRAFGDYQQSQGIRFTRLKADVGNIDSSTDQRLTALEDRVTHMEKRLIIKACNTTPKLERPFRVPPLSAKQWA